MQWQRREGNDKNHEVHVLTNDKNELLARIEGFGRGSWYPWVMDTKDPCLLRRLGPDSTDDLNRVKTRCESLLTGGEQFQSHNTATEKRVPASK